MNDKPILDPMKVMADNLMNTCSLALMTEGLDAATYDLCFGIVKECLKYYRSKRNMESYAD